MYIVNDRTALVNAESSPFPAFLRSLSQTDTKAGEGMRCRRCVSPVAVLTAFGAGLILSYILPPAVLVVLLAIALFVLGCIRIRNR